MLNLARRRQRFHQLRKSPSEIISDICATSSFIVQRQGAAALILINHIFRR